MVLSVLRHTEFCRTLRARIISFLDYLVPFLFVVQQNRNLIVLVAFLGSTLKFCYYSLAMRGLELIFIY